MNILKAIKNAIRKEETETEAAHARERIASPEVTKQFLENKEFPYLVSFSRTGSHWLRMLMELYLDKPGLRLLFFRKAADVNDYTYFHTHDLDLQVEARNVIYLYRDPVDTIFSQMMFHAQDLSNTELLDGWIDLYARHLHKWLVDEKFTQKKVILSYEGMRKDLPGEFRKISAFYGVPFNEAKISSVAGQVTKESIKEKTAHDQRVINLDKNYPDSREKFRAMYAERIYKGTFDRFPELKKFFN